MNRRMPIVALRGMTVLPSMIIHFDVNRKSTKAAIEQAMQEDEMVFLVTQKSEETDVVTEKDLYPVGTSAMVKQVVKLPGGVLRVMVSGMERAVVGELLQTEPYLYGEIVAAGEEFENIPQLEEKALLGSLHDLLEVYAAENGKLSKSVLKQLMEIKELKQLVEQVLIQIPFTLEEKLQLYSLNDIEERIRRTAVILAEDIELFRIKKEFQAKVKEKVDKNQKEYLMREQLKVIREELGESNAVSDAETYLETVETLTASDKIKNKIRKEIERFKSTASSASENAVIRGYIETLLELPWDKVSVDNRDIRNAAKVLDADHYGLEKVKERILEFLAVRSKVGKGESPIICLVGPPGTGKTSIARSVARALSKKYVRISLGGVRDEAEIRGHRRTYVGAMPGRIVTGLKSAGVKNPLMLLDEIDKVSSDYKGDTSAALLEVLDSEQNNRFQDHYIEIPVDLSEVLFIATANSVQNVPRPLLDRMELIEVSSYTLNEKVHIAKEHLVEKQKKKNGLAKNELSISKKALDKIVTAYTKEAGVRNLERKLAEVCRKAARELIEGSVAQVKVSDKNLEKYLGKERYSVNLANKSPEIGIVRGLAWTSVGGDTLQIEVNVMPGKGSFELTGQLGEVMKESAHAGISYIRSVSDRYAIDKKFFEENDIHIHIPEGAVPKDGPSAGITMATAMISAITKQPVRSDVAMTGEITLRGRVLPIGGLKEKLLAAKSAGIKTVLIPVENAKDIEEMASEILDGLIIHKVAQMEEVLKEALVPGEAI